MAATRNNASVQNRPSVYQDQIKQVGDLRAAMNMAAASTGAFSVQTVRTISDSERLTNRIRQQNVTLAQAGREWINYRNAVRTGSRSILGDAIRSQTALRNSMAVQWPGGSGGGNTDLYIPKGLGPQLDQIRTKYGMINRMLYSAAVNTVNWGKNTQWAGRQIMVGLGVPVGIIAASAGAVAMKVDEGLTRVAKVYDTYSDTVEGRERELSNLRETGLKQAAKLAREYGMALEDTINIQGRLAAIGMQGTELMSSTSEVARFATLGDIDAQTATDSIIALSTAFRDTIKDADDLAEVINYFNAVENATSLGMTDIAEAIPRAASAMAALGVDAKETAVMLVAMRESGVDAAEAANALKSGATRILDPTPDAEAAFNKLGITIRDVVDESEGNMFKFIKNVSRALHGLNEQDVQTAIAKLFGTYQFNRQTALIMNMGDALAGLAGDASSMGTQTQRAFELLGASAEENARAADQEMKALQESISHKFTAAVQGVRMALVPIGETALKVGTFILNYVITPILNFFNGLSDPIKSVILVMLGIGAVAGPILMVSGVMANLVGSIMKVALQVGNLRWRFKTLTAEEQASIIQSRTAASSLDVQASSTARLAGQVQLLTATMEKNAFASGLMMNANRQLSSNGNIRTVLPVAGSANEFRYGPGSVSASGNRLDGMRVTNPADIAAYREMERRTGQIAQNSQRTRVSMEGVGRTMIGITAVAGTFAAMASGSNETLNKWINIALMAGIVATLLPATFWTTMVTGIKSAAAGMAAMVASVANGNFKRNLMMMTIGFQHGGARGLATAVGSIAPTLARIAPMALKVFGIGGALAIGAIITKKIVDNMNDAHRAQEALATSSKNWADIMGYMDKPGALPGMEEGEVASGGVLDYQRRAAAIGEMAEANKDFINSVRDFGKEAEKSGDYARVYEIAMQQALRAAIRGADADTAKEIFMTTIQAAIPDQAVVTELGIRFDREGINLENPDDIRARLSEILNDTLIKLDPKKTRDVNWFTENFGADLSDDARAAGEASGQAFADALAAAGGDAQLEFQAFETIERGVEHATSELFEKALEYTDGLQELMDDMGISTANQLQQAIEDAEDAIKAGNETLQQRELYNMMLVEGSAVDNLYESYQELMDVIVSGYAKSAELDEGEAERLRERSVSILSMARTMGITESAAASAVKEVTSITDAIAQYEEEVSVLGDAWNLYSDEDKTRLLNLYRTRAGLEDATHWTQAFSDAAKGAAKEAKGLENAFDGIVRGAEGIMQMTPDDLFGTLKNAYQGAYNDLLAEAQSQHQAHRQAVVDSIRKEADDRDKAYDDEEDRLDEHYKSLDKSADKYWEGQSKQLEARHKQQTKDFEQYWKDVEKAADNAAESEEAAFEARIDQLGEDRDASKEAYDARIEGIRNVIDEEREAEDQRKKIFEREQERISRMANRLNTNIDFNVALNAGDLDTAAKIANDASARESKWSMDDVNEGIGDVVERRRKDFEEQIKLLEEEKNARDKALQEEIDRVKKEKDERRVWHKERMQQLRDERDLAKEAMRDQQDADKENLKLNRENDQERLRSARDAATAELSSRREATRQNYENKIDTENRITEVQNRELKTRLRVLQEFIPVNEKELREHVAEVERIYGAYGVVLKGHGNNWSGYIGDTLRLNIDASAAALQTDINWKMIAENIASKLGDGFGMSLSQVQEFLKTGNWPNTSPPTAPQYEPGSSTGSAHDRKLYGRHKGGPIPYTGGGTMSQRDRTGVPLGAGVHPSETMVLAKAGEYMVEKNAASKYRNLLDTINGGGDPYANDIGGPSSGPLGQMAAGFAGLATMIPTMVTAMVIRKKLEDGQAQHFQQIYGGGSVGQLEPGNAPWQRLWNTIKRQFPEARLTSSVRQGDTGYHGRGMAVDLGWSRAPGGIGNPYMASMNRWIYDNFRGSTELIYNGLGDDRPNIKNGRDYAYNALTQSQHRNHVHWAMTPEAIAAAGVAISSGVLGAPVAAGDSVRGLVQAEANRWGFGDAHNWNAIDWVIKKESSWNPNAQNPVSTASGLFQHIDGTWNSYKRPGVTARKMRLAPVNEQAWAGMNYFKLRYGTPANAKSFWERNRWYDDGGYLEPGATMAFNGTRRPEPVFTDVQWDILKNNMRSTLYSLPGRQGVPTPVRLVNDNVAMGESNQYNITVDLRGAYVKEEIDIQDAVEKAIEKREARNGRKRVVR